MAPDHNDAEARTYRWALAATGVSLAVLAVASVVAGVAWRGADGAWAALAGVALAAISGMVTQGAMMVGHRREPTVFAGIVAGAWLAKMFVIVIGVLALSRVAAIDRPTFGIVVLVGVTATLVVDVIAVKRGRVSYTGSSSNRDRS
jgi:hypothetical protein